MHIAFSSRDNVHFSSTTEIAGMLEQAGFGNVACSPG
jgi:hypothetical protein